MVMKNPTTMPVYWRLEGIDTLGDDFTFVETEGCVDQLGTVSVSVTFQPSRPVVLQKKFVNLEASVFDRDTSLACSITVVSDEWLLHCPVTAETINRISDKLILICVTKQCLTSSADWWLVTATLCR